MSRDLHRFFRRRAHDPIKVEFTVAPADIIPAGHVVVGTPELDRLDRDARIAAALEVAHAVLDDERGKGDGFRNIGRYNLALDILSILQPPPVRDVPRESPAPLQAIAPRFGSFRGYVA